MVVKLGPFAQAQAEYLCLLEVRLWRLVQIIEHDDAQALFGDEDIVRLTSEARNLIDTITHLYDCGFTFEEGRTSLLQAFRMADLEPLVKDDELPPF